MKKVCFTLYEILRLFVNALTADDKYSSSHMQNLLEQFQTPLSQKQKTFSDFLLHFWNVHETWSIFEKKDEYISLILSKIIDAERRGYLNL